MFQGDQNVGMEGGTLNLTISYRYDYFDNY